MRALVNRGLIVALILEAGCSSSPTAPTPAPVVVFQPPAVTPPVVTIPPVVSAPTPNPLLSDPRFDLSYYRKLALNGFVSPNALEPLRRQAEAPRIYLRTVDDAGRLIDAVSLDLTAAALINVAGSLTGKFGLAGLERGTETREGQRGWITVRWSHLVDPTACGRGAVGGDLLTLYPLTPGCRCAGNLANINQVIVKHELGHTLGFRHTGVPGDLMSGLGGNFCDQNPTDREIFHAKIAYSQPIGSLDPK